MKTRVLFTINSWALLTRGQHLWGHQSCLSMAPTSVRSPGGSLEPQGGTLFPPTSLLDHLVLVSFWYPKTGGDGNPPLPPQRLPQRLAQPSERSHVRCAARCRTWRRRWPKEARAGDDEGQERTGHGAEPTFGAFCPGRLGL